MLDGKFEIALKLIREHKNPLLEAICLIQMAQYRKAIDILEGQTKSFAVNSILAEAYLRIGSHKIAEKLISSLDKEEDLLEFHRISSMKYWFTGDLEKARIEVVKGLEMDEENAFLLNLKGIIELRMGQFELSIDHFKKILELPAGRQLKAIATVNIGAIYLQQGLLDKSLNEYLIGCEILYDLDNMRHYADSMRSIGQIYHRKGKISTALDYLEKSLNIRKKLDNKLAREYKKSTSLVMKSLNEATNYEQKIISMETEKRILEDNVAVLSSKLHEKNKQIDSANLKLDFNRELLRNYEKNPGLIKNTKEKVNAPRKDSNGKQASKL